MVSIPEYKRDDSKDYLFVLKSLNEIPFPVGKNLLVDFLYGDLENKSIEKNKMYDYNNFGSMSHLKKEEIVGKIENLIANNFIELSGSVFNKFMKVLSISKKGQQELLNPSLNSKKVSGNYEEFETQISEKELESFRELEEFLKGFNMEQKKAIVSPNQRILCIAGAGTGKTSVLTKRIQFLNKMKKVKGKKILAITFTRKAKEELEKRLEEFGINAIVETFNSFSEKILLKYGGKIYGRKMRIANFRDKMFEVLKALDNQGITIVDAVQEYFGERKNKNKTIYQLQNSFVKDCFQVFEYYKSTGLSFEKFKKKYDNSTLKSLGMVLDIVKFLEVYMSSNGFRTYGDQVRDTISFLKVYKKFIPQFEHVLIDEFQDVNKEQIELIDLINPKNIFCVGDPRQSIFGWRGSEVKHILEFKKKYPDAAIITLTKNYRSNEHIVRAMNKLISRMKLSSLESNFSGEKNLKLCKFGDENSEFNFVKAKILSSKVPREEIFVLSRTNRQIEEFSKILKREGIPHSIKEEDSRNFKLNPGEVTLATIHSIKGLEAETVFVIGCTPTNFPSKTTDHPIIENFNMYEYDREEEELRLFYVAISRAKNNLYLTYSGKKPTYFINEEMKKDFSFEEF